MEPRLCRETGLTHEWHMESEGRGGPWLGHLGRWGCHLLGLGSLGRKMFGEDVVIKELYFWGVVMKSP